ncbi:MAG: heme biosynthesis HemY N-terminal domain-containing protein [Caulobacter sp.]
MIRAALILTLVVAAAIAVLAIGGDAGEARLIWLGWRMDMTAAGAALLVLFAALAATLLWRLLIWLIEAPGRSARAREERRRKEAAETLTRGFIAAAAGDGAEARRLAHKAAELGEENPALVRVLTAQAAEAAGDTAGAKAAYGAMVGIPELRLAGLKGLMQIAVAEGDQTLALRHAETAYGLARTSRWAWRAVLEARLEAGDWSGALDLVKSALDRKIVSPIVADRARAALLAALAASQETSADDKLRKQALDNAAQAARLAPDFAPGAVMAARLAAADGKTSRAAGFLEAGWKAAPHPALWLAYRDLVVTETPRERARRLDALAALNPASREARILVVEQALIAGEIGVARQAAAELEREPLTRRLAGLLARAANAAGAADEARAWASRGAAAPQEPDWSDLDPEGRAFNYQPSDWARLVSTYAETGELVHPRLERRERTLSDLPELPAAYVESTPFVSAAEQGLPSVLPIPDDPGVEGYDDPGGDPPPPAAPPAPRRRRRLATAPRPAK